MIVCLYQLFLYLLLLLDPTTEASISQTRYMSAGSVLACRDDIDIHSFLEQQLQPRMITCLSVLLSCSPEDTAATQSKVDSLLCLRSSAQCNADADQQQQQIQAHVLVILDLMQHEPAMQIDLVQQCCQQLLLWVIQTAGSSLCSSNILPLPRVIACTSLLAPSAVPS